LNEPAAAFARLLKAKGEKAGEAAPPAEAKKEEAPAATPEAPAATAEAAPAADAAPAAEVAPAAEAKTEEAT
jgi:hypothetical protein